MDDLKIAFIVSSDAAVRERLARLLEKIGVAYILERERARVIARILELNVKLIIVDMETEAVNGIDFLRLIKKLRPRVPLIVVTTDLSEEMHNCLLDAGAMYCLVKPVKEGEVTSVVGQLMGYVSEDEEAFSEETS